MILSWGCAWHPWGFLWPILYANVSSCSEGCLTLRWFITQWVKTLLSSLVLHCFAWKSFQALFFSIMSLSLDYPWCSINTWILISWNQRFWQQDTETWHFCKVHCNFILTDKRQPQSWQITPSDSINCWFRDAQSKSSILFPWSNHDLTIIIIFPTGQCID